MTDLPDSPAKAHLREVVTRIRTSGPSYSAMTNKQLRYLRETAADWLEEHPNNVAALKRYDLLVAEIERRQRMGFRI